MRYSYLILIFLVLFSCKSENVSDNLTHLERAFDLSLETVLETLDKPAYYYRISKESANQINEIIILSDSILRLIDSNSLNENSDKYIELKNSFITLTPNANIKKSIAEIMKVPFSRENLLLEKIKIKQSLYLFLNAYQDSIESGSIDIYDIETLVLTERTKFGDKNGLNVKVIPIAEAATIYVGEVDSTMDKFGKFQYFMVGAYDSVEVVNGIGQFGYTMNKKEYNLSGIVKFENFNGERVSKPFRKKLKY